MVSVLWYYGSSCEGWLIYLYVYTLCKQPVIGEKGTCDWWVLKTSLSCFEVLIRDNLWFLASNLLVNGCRRTALQSSGMVWLEWKFMQSAEHASCHLDPDEELCILLFAEVVPEDLPKEPVVQQPSKKGRGRRQWPSPRISCLNDFCVSLIVRQTIFVFPSILGECSPINPSVHRGNTLGSCLLLP